MEDRYAEEGRLDLRTMTTRKTTRQRRLAVPAIWAERQDVDRHVDFRGPEGDVSDTQTWESASQATPTEEVLQAIAYERVTAL